MVVDAFYRERICLLCLCRAMESPGLSWRVGVQPPLDERMPGGIAALMQSKQTHAAMMEIELHLEQVRQEHMVDIHNPPARKLGNVSVAFAPGSVA